MILPFIPLEKNFPTTTMCPVGETPLSKIQKFMALFPSTFSELIADLYPSFLYLFFVSTSDAFRVVFLPYRLLNTLLILLWGFYSSFLTISTLISAQNHA